MTYALLNLLQGKMTMRLNDYIYFFACNIFFLS